MNKVSLGSGLVSFEELKSEVIDTDLCEGCGLCAGFCKAISLEGGVPTLTGTCMLSKNANACGLCFFLCPQAHPEQITVDDFQPLLSIALRSKDEKLLASASNGGFVTTFLRLLLKKKKIDAVTAVTGESRSPMAITVTKPSEVTRLAGTRYSLSGVLNEFGNSIRTNGENIAVVALPCEMRGVHRLEERLGMSFLKVSLFCSNNNRFNEDGKTEKLGSCAHCTDFFGKNADISCGFAGAEKGYTTVVALTQRGKELLESAMKAGQFESTESDLVKVKAAQSRKSAREPAVIQPEIRNRILADLEANGPDVIDSLAERLQVRPDDIIYHLLVLQCSGQINIVENRTNPYKIVWALA
jgi:coenzyme F420-reducing hydrogenase beta subunit